MSKPVVVNEAPPKQKKKSCCCSCLLAVLAFSLVVLVAGTAVGCFFLNKYTKEKFDMSLGQCLSIVNGLYWASDSKMVDYGYTDADQDAFEQEIKHQLFLKDDAPLDLEAAVKMLLEKDSSVQPEMGTVQNALLRAVSGETAGEGAAEGDVSQGTSASDKLLNFVAALFTRENMDYERLSAYETEQHDQYMFRLNDKQLAAFIDKLLGSVTADMPEVANALSQVGAERLSDAVALRQIKFVKENRTVLGENGAAGETKEVVMARVTVQVKLADVVKSAMHQYIDNDFLAGLAAFGLKTVLPNNLYATVGIGLTDNVGVDLSLNRITGEKVENAYKLIRGITGLTGDPLDVPAQLNKIASESIAPAVKTINDVADFSKVENGTLSFDTYGALANMAVEGNAEAEDPLTGQDVLFTFSRLVTSAPKTITPEHDYKNWYVYTAGAQEGTKVYVVDPTRVTDEMARVDYQQSFMHELRDKYCINLTKPDGAEYTFAEIISAFGAGGGGDAQSLLDLIDLSRFGAATAGKTEEDLKVTLTDKMLSAILAENLSSLAGDAMGADVSLQVEQVALLTRMIDGVARDLIDIGVQVDLTGILGDMGGMSALVQAFLPQKIVVSVQVDVTAGLPEGVVRAAPALCYNSMSPEDTASMLAVIDKLGIEGFNTADLTKMVADSVNQVLDSMQQHLVLDFAPSKLAEHKLNGDKGYEDTADDAVDMLLPSIYGLLEKNVFTKVGETVLAADIKSVFDGLYEYDASNADAAAKVEALKNGLDAASADYGALVGSLEQNYYLKAEHSGAITDFDTLISTLSTLSGEFDAARFDVERLKHDARGVSALRPIMAASELARLFVEKMAGALGDNGNAQFTLEGVSIETAIDGYDAVLKVLVMLDISKVMGDNANLLPVSRLYASMNIYISDDPAKLEVVSPEGAPIEYAYKTEFVVNGMSETVQNNLMRMLRMFGGEGLIDPAQIAGQMGAMLYTQMTAMNEKLGGGLTFVDGGLQMASFYEFLATATGLEAGAGYGDTAAQVAENLKAAVQGMYESTGAGDSAFNYTLDALLFNPISTTAPAGTPDLSTGKMTYSDRDMGYVLDAAIKAGGDMTAALGTLKQVVIVAVGDRAGGAGKDAFDLLNGFTDLSAVTGDLIALTFEMDINEFSASAASGPAAALLPQRLYATILLRYDGTDYTSVYFRFNAMTSAQQQILLEIAGLDTFDLTSLTKTETCTQLMSQFADAVYAASASNGVGQVTCSLSLT